MTTDDRRVAFRVWKDAVLARYLDAEQVASYNLHEPDNAFYVNHQVVVRRAAVPRVEDRLSRFAARQIVPTVALTREFRPWDEPDADDDDGDEAVFVFPRAKGVDVAEFAYDPVGRRVDGVDVNHLVTGFQRRTGWPDGDPEPAPRPLPRMPSPRPRAGAGVRVAVIDTGYPKPEAYRNAAGWFAPGTLDEVHGWDLTDEDRDGYLDIEAGHGLFVGGLVRRVAPSAHMVFLRALNSDGIGTELGIARAMWEALDKGADVINLSLGFYALRDGTPTGVAAAADEARARGVAVVAAAGNDGVDDPAYPAALPDVVGVGSLGADAEHNAEFSNFGPWVDVAAPGERVESAYVRGREDRRNTVDRDGDRFRGDWASWSGTSFACASVSGAVAAAISPDGTRDTELLPYEHAQRLVEQLPPLAGLSTRRLVPTNAW